MELWDAVIEISRKRDQACGKFDQFSIISTWKLGNNIILNFICNRKSCFNEFYIMHILYLAAIYNKLFQSFQLTICLANILNIAQFKSNVYYVKYAFHLMIQLRDELLIDHLCMEFFT